MSSARPGPYLKLQLLKSYQVNNQFKFGMWINFCEEPLHNTLLVQDFRQQKNQPLPIYRSRPSRDSYEPKTTTKKNQFLLWLLQKFPFFYFFLHKSWIWQTLVHGINIFCKWHFYYASKEVFRPKFFLNFMHGFKSAILAEWKNCQNGTFEPVHII